MSVERRKILALLGAELELTPAAGGMPAAIERAGALLASLPGAVQPSQFEKPGQPAGARADHGRRNLGRHQGRSRRPSSSASAPAAPSRAAGAA